MTHELTQQTQIHQFLRIEYETKGRNLCSIDLFYNAFENHSIVMPNYCTCYPLADELNGLCGKITKTGCQEVLNVKKLKKHEMA
jgi:hypothetical protein